MRILIVDDDLTSRCVLQALLSGRGTIDTAVTGADAVLLFAASLELGQSYGLVCLDIVMPDMDGQAALRAIRALEDARGIPSLQAAKVLMTTGVSDSKEIFRAFRGQCEGYLVKPIDHRNLEDALRKIGVLVEEPAGTR